jgi:hypothetical protein
MVSSDAVLKIDSRYPWKCFKKYKYYSLLQVTAKRKSHSNAESFLQHLCKQEASRAAAATSGESAHFRGKVLARDCCGNLIHFRSVDFLRLQKVSSEQIWISEK